MDRNGQKNETETIDSQIIKLMMQNPQITQAEICEITEIRRSTITNHIAYLKRHMLLKE